VHFVRSRSYRGAQRPVLYGLLALFSIGASPATAQPRAGWKPSSAQQRRLRGDPTRLGLVQQLDSIAGADVRENRSVGIVAAVAKGKDTLLLKAYGKSEVEGNVPMTVVTLFPLGSDT